jgi:hypothetical protein
MDLEGGAPALIRSEHNLIEVRPANCGCTGVASTHDEAAFGLSGIIPGAELKLINRRGPQWWDSAIRKGSRVSVLVFGDRIAGYANYGLTARAACTSKARSTSSICVRNSGPGFRPPLFCALDLVQSGLVMVSGRSPTTIRRRVLRSEAHGRILGEIRAEIARQSGLRWTVRLHSISAGAARGKCDARLHTA